MRGIGERRIEDRRGGGIEEERDVRNGWDEGGVQGRQLKEAYIGDTQNRDGCERWMREMDAREGCDSGIGGRGREETGLGVWDVGMGKSKGTVCLVRRWLTSLILSSIAVGCGRFRIYHWLSLSVSPSLLFLSLSLLYSPLSPSLSYFSSLSPLHLHFFSAFICCVHSWLFGARSCFIQ